MTLEERIARGQHAERLLADEMFTAASLALASDIKDELFRTAMGSTDKREELFAEYKGFQRAIVRLSSWKSDGLIAADELAKRG
jgi:hypothetical protein